VRTREREKEKRAYIKINIAAGLMNWEAITRICPKVARGESREQRWGKVHRNHRYNKCGIKCFLPSKSIYLLYFLTQDL